MGIGSRVVRDWISGSVHYEAIASLVILVLFSMMLAFGHRRTEGRVWLYQLEVFSVWAAYLAGWSLVNRSVWTDAVVTFGAWWLACAVVGTLLVALRGRSAT